MLYYLCLLYVIFFPLRACSLVSTPRSTDILLHDLALMNFMNQIVDRSHNFCQEFHQFFSFAGHSTPPLLEEQRKIFLSVSSTRSASSTLAATASLLLPLINWSTVDVYTVHQVKQMNLPSIIPNGNHHHVEEKTSKLAEPHQSASELPFFESNLEDAWHYGCVLNSDPGCTKRPSMSQRAPALASPAQAEKTHERSQSNMKLGKSESAVGTASRNAHRKTPEMRRLFRTYDADNDGRISSGELDSVMKKLGLEISEDDLNGMVRSVDKNGDGYVDFDEFLDFQESFSADNKNGSGSGNDSEAPESSQHGNAGADDDELREAFDVFDKNKDGFISVKELHAVLRSLGISAGLTITNCEKMILAVDSNGDGQVDFLEFKDLMAADNLLP